MAMIKCRECGREISSRAETCPHCGMKTRYARQMEEKKENSAAVIVSWAISIIGTLVFAFGAMTMFQDISNYHDLWARGYNYQSPLSDHEVSVIMQMVVGAAMDIGGMVSVYLQRRKMLQ